MKYMTKEWYKTMQKTDFHFSLRVSKKAEVFSEDYFKELYKRKESEWIKHEREFFDIVFPEGFHAAHPDGSPLEAAELEESQKVYLKYWKQARPEFNVEQMRKRFKQSLQFIINHLRESLPESTLQKVADIRVLALGAASREVKKEITAYCKQNEKSVYHAMDAYDKQHDQQFESNEPPFLGKLRLHDSQVLSCRKAGKDIVLTLDAGDISKIRMKNCTVIKQDAPLHGARFLYKEIYGNTAQCRLRRLAENLGRKCVTFS